MDCISGCDKNNIKAALTIAGSDSCGGAGIQLDLKIFSDLGVYGLSAITAITAQNSIGVRKINKVPPRIITAQIDAVAIDLNIDACKIGMLYTPAAIESVAERIRRRKISNVVLDTVLASKDGTLFLAQSGIKKLKKYLIPASKVITPNIPEAEILTGMSIKSVCEMKQASVIINDMGCEYVMLKGGHLAEEPIDILFDGSDHMEIIGTRIAGIPVHGTGCALSASIAARLALGDSVPNAIIFAKKYVAELIKSAVLPGKGNRLINL